MSIVDIILILLLVMGGVISYFKGFYKELYNFIIFLLSIALALILDNIVYSSIISKINLKTLIPFDLSQNIVDLISIFIGPILSIILIFIVSMIILKTIKFILIKTKVIPSDPHKLRYLGSTIGVVKGIIYLTIIAFFMSFTTFIPNFNVYNNSLLLKSLLILNPPLKNISDDIHHLYDDIQNLNKQMDNIIKNPTPDNINEIVTVFKDMRKMGLLTDDMIVNLSKLLIDEMKKDNEEQIDLSQLDFKGIKKEVKENEYYSIVKELFKEEILTPKLIEKIATVNNIKGINSDDIKTLFD